MNTEAQHFYCIITDAFLTNPNTKFMRKEKKTFPVGRDPETGELVTVAKAKRYPSKYIVESMPKVGYGDTGRSKSGKRK